MPTKVITLDGLETAPQPDKWDCGELVSMYSPVIDQKVQVCTNDVKKIATSKGLTIGELKEGKRGRPKGKTIKSGAKRPTVPTCTAYKKTTNSKGREICKCATPGNAQIQSNSKCGI